MCSPRVAKCPDNRTKQLPERDRGAGIGLPNFSLSPDTPLNFIVRCCMIESNKESTAVKQSIVDAR